MKNILVVIVFLLAASACSVGTKTDLKSGLSVSYNGFMIGETSLVNDENQKTSSNEVKMDKTFAILVEDIQNYELKDGRAFPGLDILVTDKAGTTVLNASDILANEDGYTPEDAAVLRGTITAGRPMQVGETYHAKMKIYDKLKPESEIVAQVDFVVK